MKNTTTTPPKSLREATDDFRRRNGLAPMRDIDERPAPFFAEDYIDVVKEKVARRSGLALTILTAILIAWALQSVIAGL